MNKQHIITISGKPGSGKSSTGREVAKLLNYKRHSAGDMMRKIAKENDMTLEELNNYAIDHSPLDKKIDAYIKRLGVRNNIVVDSRLGFHWMPNSFKVYLELDSDTAAARIFKDIQSNDERTGEDATTITEVWDQMHDRMNNERSRYKRLYDVDPFKLSNFDLIIHTERNNPMTVALWIHDRYQKWLKIENWKKVSEKVPLTGSYK